MFPAFLFFLAVLNGCNSQEEKKPAGLDNLLTEIKKDSTGKEETLGKIDSLYQRAVIENNTNLIAESFSLRGFYFFNKNDFESSRKYYDSSIAITRAKNYTELLKNDLEMLGRTFQGQFDRDTAISIYKEGLQIAIAENDSVYMARVYRRIGFYFWERNIFDSAVVYLGKSQDILEKKPVGEDIASVLNSIGTVYYQWNIYDRALEYYVRALNILRDKKIKEVKPLVLINIGLVFKETGNAAKAKEYFQEGLAAAKEINFKMATAYGYNSIGLLFLETNRDSSFYYYRISLDLYKSINHTGGMIISLKGLAENYLRTEDHSTARKMFREILNIAITAKQPLRQAEAYRYLGVIEKHEKNYKAARDYFLQSIELSNVIKVQTFLRESYLNLSEVEEMLGDKAAALSALREYVKLNSTVENEITNKRLYEYKNQLEFEKFRRAQELQEYENERQRTLLISVFSVLIVVLIAAVILLRLNSKKKKINTLLQEQNEIIKSNSVTLQEKNSELVSLNYAKDRLFSIIAHDLKNPFFVMINAAELLKEDYKILPDEERLSFIGRISDTANGTYNLLENLLNLSASRTGVIDFNPQNLEVAPLFESIEKLYKTQMENKQISFSNTIPAGLVINADKGMMELVFRNLINNAVKYSNTGGLIKVAASRENGSVLISVEDNGTGMSEEVKNNLFSETFHKSVKGTRGEKGTGLGISLCKDFVDKNGGKISVTSQAGKGTVFTIEIPDQKHLN